MNRIPVIAVFGAGSVGCYLGGRLLAGGANVIFIGRPLLKQEIASHGLHLTDWKGYCASIEAGKIRFETDPAAVKDADIVLLTVKCRDTLNAAKQLQNCANPDAMIVSLQNGVRNKEALNTSLPGRTVLSGIVPFNILRGPDGHFHCGTEGEIILEKAGGREAPLAAAFEKAGIPVVLKADVRGVLWTKLLINLNNAVNALAGIPLVEELKDRQYRTVLALCIEEGLQAMCRAGISAARMGKVIPALLPSLLRLPDWLFLRTARAMLDMDDQARSSMWDDLERRRPTEIDYLNGEIAALAKKNGLSAPVNEAVIALVKKAESAGQGSPRLSAGKLRDAAAGITAGV